MSCVAGTDASNKDLTTNYTKQHEKDFSYLVFFRVFGGYVSSEIVRFVHRAGTIPVLTFIF